MPTMSVSDIAQQGGLQGSASVFSVVLTPSDSVNIGDYRALWIGGAGALSVEAIDGTVVLFSGIPAGTLMPIRVNKVRATGTTATLIIGLQ